MTPTLSPLLATAKLDVTGQFTFEGFSYEPHEFDDGSAIATSEKTSEIFYCSGEMTDEIDENTTWIN